MNILVKLPSRERPDRLKTSVLAMKERQKHFCAYHFALDDDDDSNDRVWIASQGTTASGPRVNKVEAINRGLDCYGPWDILVLASDDMVCQVKEWDEIIRDDMRAHFPDTDGCLWYPDGHQDRLCTLPVMGRKYYERFGYIYHPSYKSLWCDNEQHDVAQAAGKLWRSDQVLFKHMHPAWGTAKTDALYRTNEALDHVDRTNYHARKALGFPQ